VLLLERRRDPKAGRSGEFRREGWRAHGVWLFEAHTSPLSDFDSGHHPDNARSSMKRTRTYTTLAGVLASVAGAGAALAAAQPAASTAQLARTGHVARSARSVPSAHATRLAKVELAHRRIGAILTSSTGLTLYEFTRDRANEDRCVKLSGCAGLWPALETSGQPVAGTGVKSSLLSSIRISGGVKQVTYAGHALYTYSADRPGSTSYVGVDEFGGRWYALSASGRAVK
jgi:predicted lipoprotein with Yx(FWY)xxD motif